MLSYMTTIRYKTPFRCNWSPVPLKRVTSKESESRLEQETAIKLQTPSKIMIAGPYSKLMSHSEHESKKFSSQVCTVKKPQQVILMWLRCLKSHVQYLSMSSSYMRTGVLEVFW